MVEDLSILIMQQIQVWFKGKSGLGFFNKILQYQILQWSQLSLSTLKQNMLFSFSNKDSPITHQLNN